MVQPQESYPSVRFFIEQCPLIIMTIFHLPCRDGALPLGLHRHATYCTLSRKDRCLHVMNRNPPL